jgi:AraC-like DNA-binding protein
MEFKFLRGEFLAHRTRRGEKLNAKQPQQVTLEKMGHGLDAAEAAFQVGYESPSPFGTEYRRMFGAPLRQDVTSLKVMAQAASLSDA